MNIQQLGHLLAALHFWFSCFYDWNYVVLPTGLRNDEKPTGYDGKLKFLTFWDALLQAFFFTICLLNDYVGTNETHPNKTPFIRKFRDTLMCCLAFPLALFVGASFWGLYAVDRELIFPKVLDDIFPSWLNHAMHTNIVLFIFIELLTSYRKYPSRKQGLLVLILFMATYLVWIHILNSQTGRWVYPIFDVLNLPGRIFFFVVSLVLITGFYVLGEKMNTLRWGSANVKKVKSK